MPMNQCTISRAALARFFGITFGLLAVGCCFGAALPAPTLTLSANEETSGGISYRGWPILLRLEVLNEFLMLNPSDTNVQVIVGAAAWTDGISISVTGPGGPVSIQLQPANQPKPELELNTNQGGETGWWIPPSQTAALPVGNYVFQASLNTSNATNGWKGLALSRPVRILIADEPASLIPEQFSDKYLRSADYLAWQGDVTAAIGVLQQLLAVQSTNVVALTRAADLSVFNRDSYAGLEFYEKSLEAFSLSYPTLGEVEPPAALLRKRRQVLSQLVFPPADPYLPVKASVMPGPSVALQWPAHISRSYAIESSVDLKTWSLFNTISALTNPHTATFPATNHVRFFRVRESQP